MNGGMSAIGTKRTLACALQMSANDPKRTLRALINHFVGLIALRNVLF